jgi:hypothetical protein
MRGHRGIQQTQIATPARSTGPCTRSGYKPCFLGWWKMKRVVCTLLVNVPPVGYAAVVRASAASRLTELKHRIPLTKPLHQVREDRGDSHIILCMWLLTIYSESVYYENWVLFTSKPSIRWICHNLSKVNSLCILLEMIRCTRHLMSNAWHVISCTLWSIFGQ